MSDDVVERISKQLTSHEYKKNSTLQSLSALSPHLSYLVDNRSCINKIVDLGCGRGEFVALLGNEVNATEVHGVDLTNRYRKEAEERGVIFHVLDLEADTLPFDDESVDLVVSFGVLEHLKYYDNLFNESYRIIDRSGSIWLAVPNLGSYLNRLSLLFGYQPRNVEISAQKAPGLLPIYPHTKPIDHVHAPTHKALKQLAIDTGFTHESTVAISPYQKGCIMKVVDKIAAQRPSLARRFALLATK